MSVHLDHQAIHASIVNLKSVPVVTSRNLDSHAYYFKTIHILLALSESLTAMLKIFDLFSILKPVVFFSGNLNLTLQAPGFISFLESVLF